MKKLIIGLTGGIASGKSTVQQLFINKKATVIDTDQISREIVQPNQPAYQAIIEHFGTTIVNKDNTLNRQQLGLIVFNNASEKKWLEQCLHPLIKKIYQQRALATKSAYCIIAIPLLYETWPNSFIDRVCVVDCDPAIQLLRLLQRNPELSIQQAQQRILQQATRKQRLSIADDVISNSGTLVELETCVTELHKKYREFSNR